MYGVAQLQTCAHAVMIIRSNFNYLAKINIYVDLESTLVISQFQLVTDNVLPEYLF